MIGRCFGVGKCTMQILTLCSVFVIWRSKYSKTTHPPLLTDAVYINASHPVPLPPFLLFRAPFLPLYLVYFSSFLHRGPKILVSPSFLPVCLPLCLSFPGYFCHSIYSVSFSSGIFSPLSIFLYILITVTNSPYLPTFQQLHTTVSFSHYHPLVTLFGHLLLNSFPMIYTRPN